MQFKFLRLYGTDEAQLANMCNAQSAAGWTFHSAVTIYSIAYLVFTKSGTVNVGVSL